MSQTYEEILAEWQKAKAEANKWTAKERELRLSLFGGAVPTPKEGTNNVELADGRICKFTHKLNRTVDQTKVANAENHLRKLGVNDTSAYLKPKYELGIKAYKSADPEVRKVLDAIITTKPALPTLEVK